tara:strand:+ start:6038 stop:6820 length:783 start_codon:yes stop_codon:yes gene_type:complete
MKICITGTSGFVGNYLSVNMPKNYIVEKINLRGQDLANLNNKIIKKIFSSDVVINSAASLHPKTSNDFFLNEEFLNYLLNLNKIYNKRIIHLSTINCLIKDRIDRYTLSKKISEKKSKNFKNLTIIRLPLVIMRKKNILQPKGPIVKFFHYLNYIKLPIYPMIYPGHLYQPIDIKLINKTIINVIRKNKSNKIINLTGKKKLCLWDIFKEIADMKKKRVCKVDLRFFYRFMPVKIKLLIKRQNNFLQQFASIDHSKLKPR